MFLYLRFKHDYITIGNVLTLGTLAFLENPCWTIVDCEFFMYDNPEMEINQ